MPYDLVVKGGRVIDGSGSPWVWADIAVNDGKIADIGKIKKDAIEIIDASGLCVSPGWIDVHMHADHTVLGNTRCESYIHQGVTTATMGNCGLSMYPLLEEYRDDLISYLKPFTSGLDLNWNWRSLSDFIDIIEAEGVGINLVPFVGHGSIRINVMGFADREPDSSELESMKGLLTQAMTEGAYGMSSGLGYPPGVFTKDDELVALGKTLSKYDGLYTTHMRGRVENLKETISLGVKAGIPIQVSHLGSSCASHRELSGNHEETTLKAIDEARANGLDITADIYPYVAGSSLLSQVIPDWAHRGE
ncbi:MAG: amidohydrolase family protein [Candidatus Bathyarchaeota archaeon]|nr:amidohydrolase family protein [Candidatus Bathyarchaeota archaeon]